MDNPFDYRRKNREFQSKLRRQQLDRTFAEQRQIMLKQNQASQYFHIIDEIKDSLEKQKEFLKQCSLELTGDPSSAWLNVVEKLKASTMAFNGEFQDWFTSSIISSLSNAIKEISPSYKNHLIPSICILLSDMVYLAWQKNTNFNEKLMEFELIDYVISHGQCTTYSFYERVQMLRFCGNLSRYSSLYRSQLIRAGGGIWAQELGIEILKLL